MRPGEVRVLGPVEVVGPDGPVALARQQQRLLAALVLNQGRASGVDELVEATWGGSAPASGRKLVQVYVSQLRKALPAGIVIATRGGAYALELEGDVLDAARFERLLDEGRAAREAGNAALATSLADRALALLRGRAYGELAYEDFARTESERLEELRLDAVEERLAAQLGLGRHEEALGEVLAFAEEQPFRERAHELAMLALYRCGRQSDALEHYATFRARLDEELGLEPGPALRELQRRILQQDASLAIETGEPERGTLPAPPNPLVGRARARGARRHPRAARIAADRPHGAGGSGKTRLALEAARRAADSYANGVVLVELAPLRDPSLVVPTIAQALDVTIDGDAEPLDVVACALEPLELLLVVDNAEHVRDAAVSFPELASRAPRVTLLVTSRAVLHVSGERVFPVAPLPDDDAVELFAQRARLLEPSFAITPENEADVREICRRVDGLPLAIELAAARVRTLTPRAMRDRLERCLGLLTSGPRDLPARQRTIRETIAWSVDLLDDRARRALARLSVFPAGATLEAAEQVCEADLDTFSALVDEHLVQRGVVRARTRLALMETLREFAAELLAADPSELDATRRRHAEWCLALAEQAEPNLSGDGQSAWLDELDAEHDSLRAALDYLDEVGETDLQLKLTVLLSRFWYVRGFPTEGRSRLERVLGKVADQPPLERRRAYTSAASLALLQGDHDAAVAFAESALEAARDTDELRFLANAYSNLGAIRLAAGDAASAESALEEAVRLARDAGDERIAALAINNLGDLALTLGDYDRAGPLFEESLVLLRAREDTANIARSLFNNGAVDLMRGRIPSAETRFRESLELAGQSRDREDIAWSLLGLAAVELANENGERGAMLLGAARRVLAEMSAALKPFERQLDERVEVRSRALNGDETHDAAVARGLALSVDEALELALGQAG
jgi:predicted ATPase/DNA-binding SARP family transcriptional activator